MGLALQPAARRAMVDVAVNVDLQQRARMIGWTSGRFWNHTVKAQRPEIQLIDKHVDHPHRVVLSNVVLQILGKQNALYTVFTLDEARHLTPPAGIIQNYNSTGVFTQPRSEAEIQTWGNRWERCLQGLIRIGEAGAAAPRRCHGHHEWLDQKS